MTLQASPFTILCTLEKGPEAYYSGVRVVVFAKKIGLGDEFAKNVFTHSGAEEHDPVQS